MPCARTQSAAPDGNTWKVTRLSWSGGVQAEASLPFDALISTAWYRLSCCFGSLPRRKRSAPVEGQSGEGSKPEGTQTRTFTTPSGGAQPWAGRPCTALASTLLRIGAAVIEPSASFIALLSLLPVQTPTAICGV